MAGQGCNRCGSSDAVEVYEDGAFCFSCQTKFKKGVYETVEVDSKPTRDSDVRAKINKIQESTRYSQLPTRKISKKVALMYGVRSSIKSGKDVRHYYPYYDNKGGLTGYKVRDNIDKKFFVIADNFNNGMLFGQNIFPKGGDKIIVCEGELDALAAHQMLGGKYPCVSVKSASSAKKDCANNYDYLNSFKKIVLAFDDDKGKDRNVGQESAEQVAKIFDPSKIRILNMRYKDPNDYLIKEDTQGFREDFLNVTSYRPNGLVSGGELWDALKKKTYDDVIPTQFEGLNKKIYGLGRGQLLTVTAGTGVGKSTFLRELAYNLVTEHEQNVGMFMLEETEQETAQTLGSVHLGKTIHLPDSDYTEEDRKEIFDNFLSKKDDKGNPRLWIYPTFAEDDIDTIINRIRFLAESADCKYIILDHISIMVSGAKNRDERRALDEICTKLKLATVSLDICLICVVHLKRTQGAAHEEGGVVSLQDLRGTQGIAQLSNIVLALERDIQAVTQEERNTITIKVLKNRFCGRTGPASKVRFNEEIHRFVELGELDQEESSEDETDYMELLDYDEEEEEADL